MSCSVQLTSGYSAFLIEIENYTPCRDSISAQLQLASAKCDSLQLARTIAEEQLSEAEKEKTMKELEMRKQQAEHKSELAKKELAIADVSFLTPSILPLGTLSDSLWSDFLQLEDSNKKALTDMEDARRDKDELNEQIKKLKSGMSSYWCYSFHCMRRSIPYHCSMQMWKKWWTTAPAAAQKLNYWRKLWLMRGWRRYRWVDHC